MCLSCEGVGEVATLDLSKWKIRGKLSTRVASPVNQGQWFTWVCLMLLKQLITEVWKMQR